MYVDIMINKHKSIILWKLRFHDSTKTMSLILFAVRISNWNPITF